MHLMIHCYVATEQLWKWMTLFAEMRGVFLEVGNTFLNSIQADFKGTALWTEILPSTYLPTYLRECFHGFSTPKLVKDST
jgi:hypothetical protein